MEMKKLFVYFLLGMVCRAAELNTVSPEPSQFSTNGVMPHLLVIKDGVLTTNLSSSQALFADGAFLLRARLPLVVSPGFNIVSPYAYGSIGVSSDIDATDPTIRTLSLSSGNGFGQIIIIENTTNIFPGITQSAFSITNGTPQWDDPTKFIYLSAGDWKPTVAGEAIWLFNTGQYWHEIIRVPGPSGGSGTTLGSGNPGDLALWFTTNSLTSFAISNLFNPTVDYMPYKGSPTNWLDSPFHKIGNFWWGGTNFIFNFSQGRFGVSTSYPFPLELFNPVTTNLLEVGPTQFTIETQPNTSYDFTVAFTTRGTTIRWLFGNEPPYMLFSSNRNVVIGNTNTNVNRTTNYLYIPFTGGTPIGTPVNESSHPAIVYDKVADLLYAWNPSTGWHIVGTNIFYGTNNFTINPTDNRVSMRVSTNALGDSPMLVSGVDVYFDGSAYIPATNFVGELEVTNGITLGGVRRTTWPIGTSDDWTNDVPLGVLRPVDLTLPLMFTNGVSLSYGKTNVLYSTGTQLVYTNGAVTGNGVTLSLVNGHNVQTQVGVDQDEQGVLWASSGKSIRIEPNGGVDLYTFSPIGLYTSAGKSLGISALPWDFFYSKTNFESEVVVTNGITLGGVRRTTWPSGGSSIVVSNYYLAVGNHLNISSNVVGTNTTWTIDLNDPLSLNFLYGISNLLSEVIITNGLTLGGVRKTEWPIIPDVTNYFLSVDSHLNISSNVSGTNVTWSIGLNDGLLMTNNIVSLNSAALGDYIDVSKDGKATVTNIVSGAVTYAHATNGVAGQSLTVKVIMANGSGDQTLTINSNWRTNVFSPVPTTLTNGTITVMYLEYWAFQDTATSAKQTNCAVSFAYFK